MEIRKANAKDFKEIKNLAIDLFREESIKNKILDPEWEKISLPNELTKRFRSKKWVYFIAEENGNALGFASGQIQPGTSTIYKEIGYVHSIFVSKSKRKKGIGSRLMKTLLGYFKEMEIKYITVKVYSNNTAAQNLYKSGFKDSIMIMEKY